MHADSQQEGSLSVREKAHMRIEVNQSVEGKQKNKKKKKKKRKRRKERKVSSIMTKLMGTTVKMTKNLKPLLQQL